MYMESHINMVPEKYTQDRPGCRATDNSYMWQNIKNAAYVG